MDFLPPLSYLHPMVLLLVISIAHYLLKDISFQWFSSYAVVCYI